ncbi:MAG: glycosyltransferase family 4 protein [Armatimonadota bacterium]
MRLLIISHTEHYRSSDTLVGWGPTVRELDYLARLFNQVRHIAWLQDGPTPASALPYTARNLRLVPVRPSGGDTIHGKLTALATFPAYARTILRELRSADVVHVRCPANISMLAIVLLAFVRRPKLRWVKYAGNWRPNGREPWSYTFQRWWLNLGLHRGIVTVNGRWPDQPPHVHSFLNPCLTSRELEEANQMTANKKLAAPVRLLFVGRVEEAKGAGRALCIMAELVRAGLRVSLDLVGNGPERPVFERMAVQLGVKDRVTFHGWLPRTALPSLYAQAHILLLPTRSEGWPKALSEAMAYGAVPVAGAVSSIPQILEDTGAGIALDPLDIPSFVDAIQRFVQEPDLWWKASTKGREAAQAFTYEAYIERVKNLLGLGGVSQASSGLSTK